MLGLLNLHAWSRESRNLTVMDSDGQLWTGMDSDGQRDGQRWTVMDSDGQ